MLEDFLQDHCTKEAVLMSEEEINKNLKYFKKWLYITDRKLLNRVYEFEKFSAVKHLLKGIIKIIDQENHHPNVTFGSKYLIVSTFTHKIEGVSRNDFILAAKIEDFFLHNFVIKK